MQSEIFLLHSSEASCKSENSCALCRNSSVMSRTRAVSCSVCVVPSLIGTPSTASIFFPRIFVLKIGLGEVHRLISGPPPPHPRHRWPTHKHFLRRGKKDAMHRALQTTKRILSANMSRRIAAPVSTAQLAIPFDVWHGEPWIESDFWCDACQCPRADVRITCVCAECRAKLGISRSPDA